MKNMSFLRMIGRKSYNKTVVLFGENIMRKLIDYIHSCFCKHEWECLKQSEVYTGINIHIGTRWTCMCKKCGRFKTYEDY